MGGYALGWVSVRRAGDAVGMFDSLLFQLLARFDRLSPCPGFLLCRHGARRGVLLHGRQWVDGVEEGSDF